ncbi:stalk domain-containing protein [Paenibacillus protaetiae]|nr:stalk domain-containing protein [Paenibacillus protaetiae]
MKLYKKVNKLYKKFSKLPAWFTVVSILASLVLFPNINIAKANELTDLQSVSATETKTANVYSIVAVGDSVTAGYEHGFTAQSVPYGYVERVYEQALFHGLRAGYANYALLGLKTEGLANQLEAAADGTAVTADDIQPKLSDPRAQQIAASTAQLGEALKTAQLVVLTIGGNDFLPIMESLQNGGGHDEQAAATLAAGLEDYKTQLARALASITKLNPDAKIEIADQYLPVPAPVQIGNTTVALFPEDARQFLLGAAKELREALDSVTAGLQQNGYNVSVVPVAAAFEGHELQYTSIAAKDIHPTQAGYDAMGKAFANAIWGDYRTLSPQSAQAPIAVVVNGKQLITPYPPDLKENRTFVAMRDITDALGAKLDWNNANQTATVQLNGNEVEFKIGSSTVLVNGKATTLNAPAPYLRTIGKESKTYLPLAALSEGLGLQTVYRSTLQAAFINS